MQDDRSIFFGYYLVPGDITYFDVAVLMEDGMEIEDHPCPTCLRGGTMEVILSDSEDSETGHVSGEDLFGVLLPVEILILKCRRCGRELLPAGLILKNETTGGAEEMLAEDTVTQEDGDD